MRQSRMNPIEPLESRRLFANYALDVDIGASRIYVTASLNGESLGGTDGGRLDGTQDVSVTRRGVAFSDGDSTTGAAIGSSAGSTVDGTAIDVVDANGNARALDFRSDDGGEVTLSSLSLGLAGARARVRNGRFSTRSIVVTLNEGELGVTESALQTDISGLGGDVVASNGRVSGPSSSSEVIVPFAFTTSTTIARSGFSSAQVRLTFSGKIVGTLRDSDVFGTTPGVSFPQAVQRDRVVSEIFG